MEFSVAVAAVLVSAIQGETDGKAGGVPLA